MKMDDDKITRTDKQTLDWACEVLGAKPALLKALEDVAGGSWDSPPSSHVGGLDSAADMSLAPHEMCKLRVMETRLGLEVAFTIPSGMNGLQILQRIEKANQAAEGGVVKPNSILLKDFGLTEIMRIDTQYITTICLHLGNRTRSQQEGYLKEHDLEITPRWIVTLAAALYRDKNKFPPQVCDISTERDQGILFRAGNVIRTHPGYVWTHRMGIDGIANNHDHLDARDLNMSVAGSNPLALSAAVYLNVFQNG